LASIWALGTPKWSNAKRPLSFRFGNRIGTPFWTPTWPPRVPQNLPNPPLHRHVTLQVGEYLPAVFAASGSLCLPMAPASKEKMLIFRWFYVFSVFSHHVETEKTNITLDNVQELVGATASTTKMLIFRWFYVFP